jgi:hypothetical protein
MACGVETVGATAILTNPAHDGIDCAQVGTEGWSQSNRGMGQSSTEVFADVPSTATDGL